MQTYLQNKLPEKVKSILDDPNIIEVMRNPQGGLWGTALNGDSIEYDDITHHEAESFVHAVAQATDQFIDYDKPFLDAVLPFNGERFNATIPPICKGISFNIRKHSRKILALDDYVNTDVITMTQADFLKQAIRDRKNIIVSGGPCSGKTTFTNALLNQIAIEAGKSQRVIILEDTEELQCTVPNHKAMMTTKSVDMRTLLWITMRNSPDRIIVGEVRDGAALDLLKALNTGCPGGLATIHANSGEGSLQRFVDLSHEAISTAPYHLIGEAIDVVVQIEQDATAPAGRRVTSIIEVLGYDHEKKTFSVLHHLGEDYE